MSLQQTFNEYVNRTEKTAIADLDTLWDELDSVDQAFMLGQWTGGVFVTGHPGEKQLTGMKWSGKHFHSINDVDPIVCIADDGSLFASPVMGKATCRMVGYRNSITATMVYDNHSIFDHFKKVDENTALGVMDSKGDAFPLYFYLRRTI